MPRYSGEAVDPNSVNPWADEDEKRLKHAEYMSEYRRTNTTYRINQIKNARLWFVKNREVASQRTKNWAKNNREKVNILTRRWREKHRARVFQDIEVRNWISRNSGYGKISVYLYKRGIKPPRNFHMSIKKGIWFWTFAHP